ncbi:MAG: efflux RND transporter periplasmic adaptor subunit [Pseudomonadota bacterium]
MIKDFLFRSFRALVVIAAACGVAVTLYATREKPAKRENIEPVPVVEVIRARFESRSMSVEAYGTVIPRKTLRLAAEVPGRIIWLDPRFVEGGEVDQGEVLVRIDSRSYALETQTARVMIVQARTDIQRMFREIENLKSDRILAQANADLSARELARQQVLSKGDFTSQTRLDQAMQRDIEARSRLQTVENNLGLTESIMKQKQSALDMAQLTLDKASLAMEKTEIKAGFHGFVTARTVEQGEFVGVGQPLGSIYLAGALDVDVSVPLEKMAWLDPMIRAGELPSAEVTLSTDSGGQMWKARVSRVKAAIDERTRTLPLVLELEPSSGETGGNDLPKPGTFVRCTIDGVTQETMVVLPRYLLRPDNTLYVVDDGKLATRQVTVLRKFQESVFISAGLREGEPVIATPIPKAVDGMQVLVREHDIQAGPK